MKKVILIPFTVVLLSCTSSKITTGTTTNSASEINNPALKYEILTESAYQGKEEKSFEVIDSDASLSKIYESINSEAVPEINFAKERVVALFLGGRNSGGYSVKIKSIEEREGKVYVSVEEIGPKPGEQVMMSLTNPFLIVKINTTKQIIVL